MAGNWQGIAVNPSNDDQEMPDIDGSIIVYQQLVEGDWDVTPQIYPTAVTRQFLP